MRHHTIKGVFTNYPEKWILWSLLLRQPTSLEKTLKWIDPFQNSIR